MTDGRDGGDAGGTADPDTNRWDPEDYDDDHGFVAAYGEGVVDLLDPRPGERVLDLGCGTGHLSADIAERVGPDGAVLGIDRSAEMVGEARGSYPDLSFVRADAREFAAEGFDAVFSNAALHWIPGEDHDAVLSRVGEALRPGGRFVAEMGGSGNVSAIVDATLAELRERGYDRDHPWYFPSVGEYAARLETHGFEVRDAHLFDRPTDLDGGSEGLRNWLGMFGDSIFAGVAAADREAILDAVEDRLREELYDAEQETWTADYRRLRFRAVGEARARGLTATTGSSR